MLPPSEYKFARAYDFIPVYLQYFQGWREKVKWEDFMEGEDYFVTWDDDPDLYHMPYRVLPINLGRGKVARSLWLDFIDELTDNNLTLSFFVPNILETLQKEMEDLAGTIQFMQSDTMGVEISKESGAWLDCLEDTMKFLDYLKDVRKETPLGGVRLGTPGSKDGYDLGMGFYLGFDVSRVHNRSHSDTANRKTMDDVMWLGIYYDAKKLVRICMELAKKFKKKEPKAKEPEKPGTVVPSGLDRFRKFHKDWGKVIKLTKEFKKMTKGLKGRSGHDYVPLGLYMLQQEHGFTDQALREEGDLARELGYDLVDIVLLRHRNGFGPSDLRYLRGHLKVGHGGTHGLTCIVDIGPTDVDDFLKTNRARSIEPKDYCEYGETEMDDWRDIWRGIDDGMTRESFNRAAAISLPFQALIEYYVAGFSVDILLTDAEKVSSSPGHGSLFRDLKTNRSGYMVIEVAARYREDPNIIIRPEGAEGPDIYLGDRLVFVSAMEEDLDGLLASVLLRSFITSDLVIDFRWADEMNITEFSEGLKATALMMDPTGKISTYILVHKEETVLLFRMGDEFLAVHEKGEG
jgi:hypothetical protein